MFKLKYGIGGALGSDKPVMVNGKNISDELSEETARYYTFKYMLCESAGLSFAIQVAKWLNAELENI